MYTSVRIIFALVALTGQAIGAQILKTSGFTTCSANPDFTVQKVNIEYNNENKTVNFDVAGTAMRSVNVTAILNVTAYGTSVYSNSFNPCDGSTFVKQLCPVPAGTFAASGTQSIPAAYASLVPAIAFSVPDISAQATLQLKSLDTNEDVACITSQVTNGQTVNVPAVSYASAGIAGAALVLTGATSLVGALSAGGATGGGGGTTSPGFVDVITVFQGFAMNGMMSVNYPPIYRAFAKNFAFSTGIVPWTAMQSGIDSFRARTGGNLTQASVEYLRNATLVFADGSTKGNSASILRRGLTLVSRQITTSINGSTNASAAASNDTMTELQLRVSGISAYIEDLSVPKENSFMTALLVVAIIIVAIVVGILLFKAILETWALFGSFPKSLTGFRKHYWGTMARSIVQLILMLYGVLVLYSIFQFTQGDSWAAKALAGVVLAGFSAVLAFFAFKIWRVAKRSKEDEGDASMLYDEKDIWLKYSIFYDSYKKDFWWTFLPVIAYMFAKGCVLAAADGHGLAQTIAQLVIEAIMLLLLIFCRPYERKSGNIINIFIQVVRALSVVCILVFVEELGIAQTTQTVTGVVLIAVQSALTALLAILIIVNAIIICCKENPHRKRRKEAEKLNRDFDNLTPLHAHNSLLMKSANNIEKNGLAADKERAPSEVFDDPKLPFLQRSSTKQSYNTSVSSFQEPSNPYGAGLKPAPIGGKYTPANSYRNVISTEPPRLEPPQVYRPYRLFGGADEGNAGLVGNAAPLARVGTGGSERGRQGLNMEGFAGYRGMPGSRY